MKNSCKKKNGFTLIELLVVVIIIGVLASIAIPGYMRSMEKTKASTAMQALSDIAKAEHDYFTVRSRYTDDFSDLTITMHDEETKQDADNNSYSNKHFTFELDEDLEAAKATRSGGDAPYTLYRLFDDPRIYCQPADNKYCIMLDLPAGSFNTSVGGWQSCPGGVYPCSMSCSRSTTSGYSCYGTYNEDGTFREKVCDSNGMCVTTQYNADQKATKKNVCYAYDEDGNCTSGNESVYNENGNLLSVRKCTAWDANGNCTAGGYLERYIYKENGNVQKDRCSSLNSLGECSYTWTSVYDGNGNLISSNHSCKSYNEDGTCATFGGGTVYVYDENGRRIKEMICTLANENGTCDTYSDVGNVGHVYTYDEYGHERSIPCQSGWNDDGTCKRYGAADIFFYDENGRSIGSSYCRSFDSDLSCTNYGMGIVYTYDANGNQTSSASCSSWNTNGTCATYGTSGSVYTYDANGHQTSESYCTSWNSNGTCATRSSGYVYTYDANGNQTSYAPCKSWNTNGTCATRSSGQVYTYDANGNRTSNARCTSWNPNGTCAARSGGSVYTYDENGNQTSSASCSSWNTNGTCATYGTWGEVYTYDANGNQTSQSSCKGWNNDGTCATYGTDGIVYTYDANGNRTSESYTYCWNDECTDGGRSTNTYAYDESGNRIYEQSSETMFFGGYEDTYEDQYCYYTDAYGNQSSYYC